MAEPPLVVFLCVGVELRLSSSSLPPFLEVLMGETTAPPPSLAGTDAASAVAASEVVLPPPSLEGAGWSSLARLLLLCPPLLLALLSGDPPSSEARDSLAVRSLALALADALAARVLRDGEGGAPWLLLLVVLPLCWEPGDNGAAAQLLLLPPSARSDKERLAGSDCAVCCAR